MSFGSHSSWTSGTEKQTDQALRTSELFTVNWMYLLAGEHSMGQAVQYRPGSTTSAGEDIISLGAHRLGSTTSVGEQNISWGAQHRPECHKYCNVAFFLPYILPMLVIPPRSSQIQSTKFSEFSVWLQLFLFHVSTIFRFQLKILRLKKLR